MRYVSALAIVASLSVAPALAQGSAGIQEHVFLQSFDPSSNTYSGRVNISAAPCATVSYGIDIGVGQVKGVEDALQQVKGTADKIAEDVKKAAEHCPAQ